MASAADAHETLKNFTRAVYTNSENAGIAISKELLRRLIDKAYGSVSSGQSVALPANEEFDVDGNKYKILFDAKVDIANLKLEFGMNQGQTEEEYPIVTSSGIAMTVEAFLATSREASQQNKIHIGTLVVSFSKIVGLLSFEEQQLNLAFLESEQSTSVARTWESDAATKQRLENEFKFKEQHFEDAGFLLGSIRFVLSEILAQTYLESIELPDVFSLFPGINFEGDARLGADDDFILITAETSLNTNQCPIAPIEGEVTTEEDESGNEVRIPSGSPARRYPPGYELDDGQEYSSQGHLFLYTPKTLLEANFQGVARPSVGFGDSGRKGIFRWGYKASLMLNSFKLSLTNRPLEFQINISLGALGFGDCKVKIGCVTHRVAGIAFRGDINPLDILFRIHLDYRRREVVLVSRLKEARARGFDFMTNAPWPLSEVAEYVLKKVARKSVKDQAGKILTVTRIPIGRWRQLDDVAPMQNVLALHEDPAKDSVSIGAVFDFT